MSISQILISAKVVIEKPENWTRGWFARDAENNPVHSAERNAVCFCSLGAVRKVMFGPESTEPCRDKTYNLIVNLMDDVVRDTFNECNVPTFNDNTTHEEVLKMFDKAIEVAKEKENENI